MTKYTNWSSYFRYNAWRVEDFAWQQAPGLSIAERALIATSLPQFQLGEGSDGLGLLRRARESGQRWKVEDLEPVMEQFIREEQRHSAVLGLFLDQEQIPRLQGHWVDGAFRWIRNLAGLELMLSVLVVAECIAVPYYEAVHDATRSPLLKAIARRILRDEAQHLEFQADNLALCATGRSDAGRMLEMIFQILLLTSACALVFQLHRKLFRAAGMSFPAFWESALGAQRTIFRGLVRKGERVNLNWGLNLLD